MQERHTPKRNISHASTQGALPGHADILIFGPSGRRSLTQLVAGLSWELRVWGFFGLYWDDGKTETTIVGSYRVWGKFRVKGLGSLRVWSVGFRALGWGFGLFRVGRRDCVWDLWFRVLVLA